MKKILFRFWFKDLTGIREISIKVKPEMEFYKKGNPYLWLSDGGIKVMADSYEVITSEPNWKWSEFIDIEHYGSDVLVIKPVIKDNLNMDIPQLITE